MARLQELGVAVNYNAYGETIADLHVPPLDLAGEMLAFADPLDFATGSAAFRRLADGYRQDMELARRLEPTRRAAGAILFVLPDQAWARRASGTLANDLAKAHAGSAVAIVSPKSIGRLLGFRARAARVVGVGRGVLSHFPHRRRPPNGRWHQSPADRGARALRGGLRGAIPRRLRTP